MVRIIFFFYFRIIFAVTSIPSMKSKNLKTFAWLFCTIIVNNWLLKVMTSWARPLQWSGRSWRDPGNSARVVIEVSLHFWATQFDPSSYKLCNAYLLYYHGSLLNSTLVQFCHVTLFCAIKEDKADIWPVMILKDAPNHWHQQVFLLGHIQDLQDLTKLLP